MKYKIDTSYKLVSSSGKIIEAKLVKIYSTFFSDDYIFENIQGGKALCGHSNMLEPNEFPMTLGMLDSFTITEV